MSEKVEFYYSNLSWQSQRIKHLLQKFEIPFNGILCEFGMAPDFAIYGELPVIRHNNKVIEDYRLITLYIDEVMGGSKIIGADREERQQTLGLLEELDNTAFNVVTAPVLLERSIFMPRYMRELTETGCSGPKRLWKKLRAASLAKRYAPNIPAGNLPSHFTDALTKLSTAFSDARHSAVINISLTAALEMLHGENAYWEEISRCEALQVVN